MAREIDLGSIMGFGHTQKEERAARPRQTAYLTRIPM